MFDKEKKPIKVLDNTQYKDRFQFVLSINEHIICQRYFKVNGFNPISLESEELKDALDDAVDMIKQDLVSKSRIYLWYTADRMIKLTGFKNDGTPERWFNAIDDNEDPYLEKERPQDGEFVFRFTFLVDDKPLYIYEWDANVYPKYVRNSVDLTNSDAQYRDRDPSTLHFSVAIVRHLTKGRSDLTYLIIKKLCDVMSNPLDKEEEKEWTKYTDYGDTVYSYSAKNRALVNEWRKVTEDKTRQYMAYVNNYMSDKQFEFINKKL